MPTYDPASIPNAFPFKGITPAELMEVVRQQEEEARLRRTEMPRVVRRPPALSLAGPAPKLVTLPEFEHTPGSVKLGMGDLRMLERDAGPSFIEGSDAEWQAGLIVDRLADLKRKHGVLPPTLRGVYPETDSLTARLQNRRPNLSRAGVVPDMPTGRFLAGAGATEQARLDRDIAFGRQPRVRKPYKLLNLISVPSDEELNRGRVEAEAVLAAQEAHTKALKAAEEKRYQLQRQGYSPEQIDQVAPLPISNQARANSNNTSAASASRSQARTAPAPPASPAVPAASFGPPSELASSSRTSQPQRPPAPEGAVQIEYPEDSVPSGAYRFSVSDLTRGNASLLQRDPTTGKSWLDSLDIEALKTDTSREGAAKKAFAVAANPLLASYFPEVSVDGDIVTIDQGGVGGNAGQYSTRLRDVQRAEPGESVVLPDGSMTSATLAADSSGNLPSGYRRVRVRPLPFSAPGTPGSTPETSIRVAPDSAEELQGYGYQTEPYFQSQRPTRMINGIPIYDISPDDPVSSAPAPPQVPEGARDVQFGYDPRTGQSYPKSWKTPTTVEEAMEGQKRLGSAIDGRLQSLASQYKRLQEGIDPYDVSPEGAENKAALADQLAAMDAAYGGYAALQPILQAMGPEELAAFPIQATKESMSFISSRWAGGDQRLAESIIDALYDLGLMRD